MSHDTFSVTKYALFDYNIFITIDYSQRCLAAIIHPRICLKRVRALHRVAYHF